jgi:hypothetical protein
MGPHGLARFYWDIVTLSCPSQTDEFTEGAPTSCTHVSLSRRYTPAAARVQVPLYDPDSKCQVWPHGMYTVNMTAGFCGRQDFVGDISTRRII